MKASELKVACGGIDNAPPAQQKPWEDRETMVRFLERLQDAFDAARELNKNPLHR